MVVISLCIRCEPQTSCDAAVFRTESKQNGSVHGLNPCNFGNMGAEVPLDSHLERYAAGGAAYTCTVQTNANQTCRGHLDELHIAAITLDSGSDEIDHMLDASAEVLSRVGSCAAGPL